MKKIFIILLIISYTCTFSQKKKFSLELTYPLELTDGNSSELNGIVNSKLKYRLWNTESLGVGASYSIDLLTGDLILQNEKESFISHHFNLFGEIALNSSKKLYSSVGFGYTTQSFYTTTIIDQGSGLITSNTEKDNVGGFNISFGGEYDILKNFFVEGNFQFIRLYIENFFTEKKEGFNQNRLKIGFGYRF